MLESKFSGLTVIMASSSDDMSELGQFGLYQLAEQEIDKELSPDTWGSDNLFNVD